MQLLIKEIVFDDLKQIKEYYKQNYVPEIFDRIMFDFDNAIESLLKMPLLGSQLKLKKYKRYRFVLLLGIYYLIYTVENDMLTVQRVVHTAMNLNTQI